MLEDNFIEVEPEINKVYMVYNNNEVRAQRVYKLETFKKVFEWVKEPVRIAFCIDLETKTTRTHCLTGPGKSIFLELKK
jgi:hypothetical protein